MPKTPEELEAERKRAAWLALSPAERTARMLADLARMPSADALAPFRYATFWTPIDRTEKP